MKMREVRKGVWKGELWSQGRRQTITCHGTAHEAKVFEAHKRLEIESKGIVRQSESPTFVNFCVETYKPYAKMHLRQHTWEDARRYQVERLCKFLRQTKLSDITELDIEGYKVERRAKNIGQRTINTDLSTLGHILAYARSIKIPCAHPEIRHFKVGSCKEKVQFWTMAEVQHLLDTCKKVSPSIYPLVFFLASTGCRKSEGIALTWPYVDFDRRLIKIWNHGADGYQVKSREREVPISDPLYVLLAEQKLRGLSKETVFPVTRTARKGTPRRRFPKHTWGTLMKAAGLSGGPHKLRHSYASNFLSKKPDLYLLGRLMGHTHEAVTRLYAHMIPEYLDSARNVLNFNLETDPVQKPVHEAVHSAQKRRQTK
jgi:integrase